MRWACRSGVGARKRKTQQLSGNFVLSKCQAVVVFLFIDIIIINIIDIVVGIESECIKLFPMFINSN